MEIKIDKEPLVGGSAIGNVVFYRPYQNRKKELVKCNDFYEVRDLAILEINRLINDSSDNLLLIDILNVHIKIIKDIELEKEVIKLINDISLDKAIYQVFNKYIKALSTTNDAYMKERISDFKDVLNRLLRIINDGKNDLNYLSGDDNILFCKEIKATELLEIKDKNLRAIVSEQGGRMSHFAIIAKQLDIPVILGVKIDGLIEGGEIIIDADKGIILTNPTKNQILEYQKCEVKDEVKYQECLTKDNIKIQLLLNIDNDTNIDEMVRCCDGVGLFRTEFIYQAPNQHQIYNNVIKASNGEICIRTFDLGGDKNLGEADSMLGMRSIRRSLKEREEFKEQLKNIFLTPANNLKIIIPLVSRIEDVIEAKKLIDEVKQYDYKFGIMIETPASVFLAKDLAKLVDFASIGTNDLCQYIMAVDRALFSVEQYYEPLNPAIFRSIKYVVDNFNKDLSVCGELASDIMGVCILIGLGIRKLSISYNNLGKIRSVINKYTSKELTNLANDVLKLSSEQEVKRYMLNHRR